jgi:hypothetical protein
VVLLLCTALPPLTDWGETALLVDSVPQALEQEVLLHLLISSGYRCENHLFVQMVYSLKRGLESNFRHLGSKKINVHSHLDFEYC